MSGHTTTNKSDGNSGAEATGLTTAARTVGNSGTGTLVKLKASAAWGLLTALYLGGGVALLRNTTLCQVPVASVVWKL